MSGVKFANEGWREADLQKCASSKDERYNGELVCPFISGGTKTLDFFGGEQEHFVLELSTRRSRSNTLIAMPNRHTFSYAQQTHAR